MTRTLRLRPSLALAVLLAAAPAAGNDASIYGFSAEGAAAQHALEERFDAQLDAANLRRWMEQMTAHPHPVGSPQGKANAELMAELFRSWGYETRIETFNVLFPTPKSRLLELVAPTPYKAKLVEPAVEGDRTSGQLDEQLPPYNAYSIDGDVTGELVYVNYGVPDDYDELALRGVDVAGKLVIARYGGAWRGIKPKVAAEHGAIGCILYSDPIDDGYGAGDVYPHGGGFRGPDSVQRGSVMDFTPYGGDPLTPLVGATEDAERLELDELEVLTKIPTLPISYADARPLLEALGGHVAPRSWRGGLPITYHVGPGPAKVHLKVEFNWDLVPALDVIAVLRGAEYPDQWVIRGNHHDGWVHGATDPISGMVALLEEARAVAELTKTGWRPKRTMVYAAWDAEEPALLGSIEWVETHADELREKGVVYINSDSNSRGTLSVAGSHTLEKMVNEVMRDVVDPEKGISVHQRSKAETVYNGDEEERQEARERDDIRLRPLGFGSDYTGFLQFTGISSLNLGYGGDGEYGQYHSAYDSFDHYTRYMDGDFAYGLALAQTAGRVALRLAEAEILPFELGGFVDSIALYVDELLELPDDVRLRPLGFGSDYTGFLQFIGISSLGLGYGGDGEDGQYHSAYDSFDHYTRYMDGDFAYGVALAQTAGRLALRLAEAEILPFELGGFVDSIALYVDELLELPDDVRQEREEKNRRIDDGVFEAVLDSTKTWVVPEKEGEVPHLNFAPLKNSLTRLTKAASAYGEAFASLAAGERSLTAEKRDELNLVLMHTERALLREEGLPGRPWFRHQIYAPGVYTGYAPKTIPGIRESIEEGEWDTAEEQIVVVAGVLEAFAAQVARATALIEGG